MENPHAGDAALRLDGRLRTLRLTLGGLAALEARFGADGLADLAARFETGKISAADLTALIAIGLCGAGDEIAEDDVAALRPDDGVAAALSAVTQMLSRAFGGAG